MSLGGHICVITGAAGRIGQAFVERFLREGATVVAVDLVPYPTKSDWVDSQICDLSDSASITTFERYLEERYGHVDCLVNNGAYGGWRTPLLEKTEDEFDKMMGVNVKGPLLLSQACIRLLQAAKGKGRLPDERVLSIVNIASIAGHSPVPLGSLYSMSKAALISLTKSVAKEYGQHGVRCNSVSPGNMMVPNVEGISAEVCITWICRMSPTAETQDLLKVHQSIPLARGGEPSEIAGIVAWLASDDSSFTTGSDFLIDGGNLA